MESNELDGVLAFIKESNAWVWFITGVCSNF